jgi:hypothetical protein
MLRTDGTRRRLAALLLPSFLVVHLVCFCLPRPAAAAPARHDCCPERSSPAPQPAHDASCAHCGGAQLGVAPAMPSPAPLVLVTPVVRPDAIRVPQASHARLLVDPSRGSPPLPSPLQRTCVLIV